MKAPTIPKDYVPADLCDFSEYRLTSVLAQLRGLNISTLDDARAVYSDATNTWNRLALGFWHEKEGDSENAVQSYRDVWALELQCDLGAAAEAARQLAECLVALGRLAEAVEVAEKSLLQSAEVWTQRWLWSKFYRDIDRDRTVALLEELAETSKSEIPRKLLKEILNEIAFWRLEMKKHSTHE